VAAGDGAPPVIRAHGPYAASRSTALGLRKSEVTPGREAACPRGRSRRKRSKRAARRAGARYWPVSPPGPGRPGAPCRSKRLSTVLVRCLDDGAPMCSPRWIEPLTFPQMSVSSVTGAGTLNERKYHLGSDLRCRTSRRAAPRRTRNASGRRLARRRHRGRRKT
jgi:hypothetical protein